MTQREEVTQESYEVRWSIWERIIMTTQAISSGFLILVACLLLSRIPAAQGVGGEKTHTPQVQDLKSAIESTPLVVKISPEGSYLVDICEKNGLDVEQIKRQIFIESSGDPKAMGSFGERGLMQICKPTWEEMVIKMETHWSFNDAYDAKKNLAVGCFYMNYLQKWAKRKRYFEPTKTSFVAYNCGMGNVSKGLIPKRAWRYATRILEPLESTKDIDWDQLFR